MSVNAIIIFVTFVVSLMAFNSSNVFNKLCFHPYTIVNSGQYNRLLTYGFIHGSWGHLLVNMFVLWMFGRVVESNFVYYFDFKGHFLYLLMYLSAIVISSISDLKKHQYNSEYVAIGASGATSAVVFAYILLNPLQKLYVMFIPIGIPAALFGILYLIYSAYMDKYGNDNIGHNTHLWGAIYGIVFLIVIKPRLLLAFFSQILQIF